VAEQRKEEDFSVANLLQAQRDLLAGVPAQAVQAQPAAHPMPGPVPIQAAQADDADAYINLKHYAYVICGRIWVVLLSIVLVIAAAFAYRLVTSQKFEASVKVDINDSASSGLDLLGKRSTYVDSEMLSTLVKKQEVLDDAALRVPEHLKSLLEGDVGRSLSREERDAVEAEIRRGKSPVGDIRTFPDKFFLRLTAQAEDSRRLSSLLAPERSHAAALLAEARVGATADALRAHFQAVMSNDSRVNLLKALILKNDQDLKKIIEELYKSSGSQLPAGENLPADATELMNLVQKLKKDKADADLRIVELKARQQALASFISNPAPEDQQVSPQIQARLADLHMQLALLEERYQPGHPKYQRIKDEIDALTRVRDDQNRNPQLTVNPGQAQLRAEQRSVNLEISSLEERRKALDATINEKLKAIGGKPDPTAPVPDRIQEAVQREQKLRERRLLEDVGSQLRRKRQELEGLYPDDPGGGKKAELLAVGTVSPARALGAGLAQVLGFAVMLGLILGTLLVLLLEHLDDTVRSELVAQKAANLPVIGRLPLFAGPSSKQFISGNEPRSDVAEIFKVLHNHVRYAAPNAPEKCLLITSPERDEGKSFVATNLALSFALEGNRVCFVDADLRRSRMHERTDVLRPRGPMDAGLCGYLESGLNYEDVVLPTDNENLSVILAGGRASNPPRALRSDRMLALLDRLGRDYDVVIIDTPPVLPVVDAAILASLVRSVVVVARFGATHLGDLSEASGRLIHVNAPLAGMIINGVHGAMAGYAYGYRYGYRYGNRYRYSGSYGG